MRRFYIFLVLISIVNSMQSQPATDKGLRKAKVEFGQNGLDLTLNKVRLLQHLFPHLDGSPLVLSIKEDALDTADIDFKGRWLPADFASPEVQIHASAMATIAAGAGNSDPTGHGVARGALISSSDFANLMPDEDSYFLSQNISVQNHSYGTGIENYYGIEAKAYDEQCLRLPTLLHVFSAGNQGEQASQSGTYAGIRGFANLTGQFKQSKNTLTVGACDSLGQVVPFSSKGPASDGRIKPELVAYGHGGSSGASALVSGIALLVQQIYLEKKGELPPSELVRAVLINSACDVGQPHVDFETGFGNVDAEAAAKMVLEGNYELGTVAESETKNFIVNLPEEGVSQLKITLAWNDSPAVENAEKTLVNDLDLELRTSFPDQTWLPWVLNHSPHLDSLRLEAKRGRDIINNVEQITVENLWSKTSLLVSVKGSKLSGEGQTFAIAFQYKEQDKMQWIFPTGSDYLLPGEKNLLRWESTISDTIGKLEIRFPPGNDWQTIENEVNLKAGAFAWSTPDQVGRAQLRFIEAGQIWASNEFLISEQLRPKVGFNCPDSLFFFWQPMVGATDYQIFQLGDRYLEPVAVTTETQFVADAAIKNATTHFAVAPRFEEKTGVVSYAFNYEKQGVGCYLKTFYLQQVLDRTANFKLEIGTTHGLKMAIFEKEQDGEFVPIQTISPVQNLSMTFEDGLLRQGANRYRVRLALENGGEVFSQVEVAHFLEGVPYLIFPNPAAQGNPVFLLANEASDAQFRVMDAQGKILFEGALERLTALPSKDWASGLYFIDTWNGEKRWAGKFLIGSW